MTLLKKLIIVKNELGLAVIGLLFAVIGAIVTFSGGNGDGSMIPLVFVLIGIICFAAGLAKAIKTIKTPAEELNQYDRVSSQPAAVAPEQAAQDQAAYDPNEEMEEFVFHYTGKANQSHVMKDHNGTPVYEATTDKLMMVKARPYVFRNCMTGMEETKMVGGPVTISMGTGVFGNMNISSTFKVDGTDVWDMIASQGYGFTFSLHGVAAHYEVRRYNQSAGFAELGGTGLMNPKYKDSPLGKVPTNGIFKVHCRRQDVPGLFLICFAITHTEMTVE